MKGRYALKLRGAVVVTPFRKRSHRVCVSCGKTLAGKRGHGFVTPNGRGVECQPGCKFKVQNKGNTKSWFGQEDIPT